MNIKKFPLSSLKSLWHKLMMLAKRCLIDWTIHGMQQFSKRLSLRHSMDIAKDD